MSFISHDLVHPGGGAYNGFNRLVDWGRLASCGTRVYYKAMARDGLVERMQLLLIDYSRIPALHAQEVAGFERTRIQQREDEVRRARENAEKGGTPRL
jgi:hypothetical protein